MIRMKKILLPFLFTIAIVCGVFVFTGFANNSIALAATVYFSDDKYTESDNLLNNDGSESYFTIQEFALDVKAASPGTSFPELAQVIPRQYLETSTTNDEFYYNGKEYGFYVAKEGSYFDVLLIDFVYEFDDGKEHSDLEYKIRIKPILQQTFIRSGSGDNYVWRKAANNNYTYYVANPRFLSTLRNENSLNYGDAGYSKIKDNGPIILQYRTNYGKISYATEEDFLKVMNKFTAQQVFDCVVDIFDELTFGVAGTISDVISDYVELRNDLYEVGKETPVIADNELNISTQFSKEAQKNNSNFETYSRCVGFMPNEEMVLSADSNSYAEFIVVLSDATSSCRLMQYCDFDIIRRNSNFSSMEYVAGNEQDKAFSFYKERVLYENTNRKDLTLDAYTMAYNLPGGTDRFVFTPEISGTYSFATSGNENARLSLYDKNDNSLFIGQTAAQTYLQKGTLYYLNTSLQNNDFGRYDVIISVPIWNIDSPKSNCVIPVNGQLFKINISGECGYKLNSSNSNIKFNIYDEDLYKIESTDKPYYYGYLYDGSYYVQIVNTADSEQITTLNFEKVDALSSGISKTATSDNENVLFSFTAPTDTLVPEYYSIVFNDFGSGFEAEILGNSNLSISQTTDIYLISLYLNPGECIYIRAKSSDSFTVKIDKAEYLFKWIVNGTEVEGNTVCLQRGTTSSIDLEIDGSEFNNAIWMTQGDYTFTNGNLILPEDRALTVVSKPETYIKLFVIENNTPFFLNICVTHNFELNFSQFDDVGFGFRWDKFYNGTQEDSSSFEINFDISLSGGAKTPYIFRTSNIAGNYSLLDKFSGSRTIDVYIKSVQYEPEDGYAVTIYNTNNDVNSNLTEEQSYHSFYADVFHLHTYFVGGKGTSADPYLISNIRHLENIRITANNYSYYKLINSITYYGNSNDWTPIPEFRGTIDGNNKGVSNINYNDAEGPNIGLFEINYGTIKNFHLRAYFSIDNKHSNVFVGGIAGINKGVIDNCSVEGAGNSPSYSCIAQGDSYMGAFVGSNEGTIRNCRTGAWITGSCNMGTIAGKNSGTISNCEAGSNIQQIWYDYRDYNASVGGIVGLQTSGKVINCTYQGLIMLRNYYSSDNTNQSENRVMQPCIGIIIGYKQGGTTSGNSWLYTSSRDYIVTSIFGPYVVTWKEGWWLWEKTYTHDQGLYFKDEECGRID